MGNVYSGSDPKNKLRVREVDGTPNVSPVNTIVVSNGTLTNDGGGQVTITTGGGGGGGGIGGTIAVNQVAVGSGADTISGSSGLTFTETVVGPNTVQTLLVSGSEPRIQAQDTTSTVGNRATITLDPSVPDGTGGVGMFWGTDADLELYMKLGAFAGANNIETKNRDFRFFGATGNLITMDESTLNTAVGGIFGLSNGSDPLPLPTRTLDVGKTDASTSTVLPLLGLTRTSSGTPAAGIGVGMEFVVETTANNNEIGATINAVATEVGSGRGELRSGLQHDDCRSYRERKIEDLKHGCNHPQRSLCLPRCRWQPQQFPDHRWQRSPLVLAVPERATFGRNRFSRRPHQRSGSSRNPTTVSTTLI